MTSRPGAQRRLLPVALPLVAATVLAAGLVVGARVVDASTGPATAGPATSAAPGIGQASAAPAGSAVPATPSVRPRTVFIGDSITVGTSDLASGTFGDRSWFSVMVTGSEPPLDYAGGVAAIGMSTAWMAGQTAAALAYDPSLVVVLGGTNDIAAAVPPQDVVANLQTIATAVQADGAVLAVSTIPPAASPELIPRAIALNDAIRQWAPTADVVLLDPWDLLADSSGTWLPGLSDDGVHPNALGCALMGSAARPVLLEAMAAHAAAPAAS